MPRTRRIKMVDMLARIVAEADIGLACSEKVYYLANTPVLCVDFVERLDKLDDFALAVLQQVGIFDFASFRE